MSTIGRVDIPTAEFALRETFVEISDITVEAERVVTHGKDRPQPRSQTRSR